MAVREERHAGSRIRRILAWLPDAVVVLLVVAAAANLQFDLGARWFGLEHRADQQPAAVSPPEGLDLREGSTAPVVAGTPASRAIDAGAVHAALTPYVGAADLGRHVDVA